jgi:hypothetical protein
VARKGSPATGIAPGNGRLIPGRPLTAARLARLSGRYGSPRPASVPG